MERLCFGCEFVKSQPLGLGVNDASHVDIGIGHDTTVSRATSDCRLKSLEGVSFAPFRCPEHAEIEVGLCVMRPYLQCKLVIMLRRLRVALLMLHPQVEIVLWFSRLQGYRQLGVPDALIRVAEGEYRGEVIVSCMEVWFGSHSDPVVLLSNDGILAWAL